MVDKQEKQTEKEQINYSSFEKYQYGALAAQLYASKENKRYASSALEVLAGEKGLNLGEEALGFIRGTQASEKGVETAINVYASKFQEKKGEYTPSQLIGWYEHLLNGLDNKEKEKIVETFKEHDETLKNINKKLQKASHIAEGEDIENLYTKEQISDAKKTIEKYQKLMITLQVLDKYKLESLRPEAVNTARVQDLKGLVSKL